MPDSNHEPAQVCTHLVKSDDLQVVHGKIAPSERRYDEAMRPPRFLNLGVDVGSNPGTHHSGNSFILFQSTGGP